MLIHFAIKGLFIFILIFFQYAHKPSFDGLSSFESSITKM